MTIQDYEKKIRQMWQAHGYLGIHVSPDFQCDETGGFPTSLCACWKAGTAWLELNESMIVNEAEASCFRQMCADYGFKSCWDSTDFNRLLEGLGEDAVRSAELFEEDEDV